MKNSWKLKRPLSILLCGMLLAGSMPAAAFADSDVPGAEEASSAVSESGEAQSEAALTDVAGEQEESNQKTEVATAENAASDETEIATQPTEETAESEEAAVSQEQPVMMLDAVEDSKVSEIPEETCTVDYSKQQSDSVTYDRYEKNGDVYNFYYTIGEDAGDDIVIDLSQCALSLWNDGVQLPGDHYKFQILIKNESGNYYRYKDNSFVLAPGDASEFGSLEDGSALPVLTYDGQYLPINFAGAMIPYYFYKDVFGVSSSGNVTFEMMCQIYDYLAQKGYTGDTAISDYMLNYYNNKRGTDYDTLTQLFADHPDWVDGNLVTNNGIWTMTQEELEGYIAQYPWIDPYVSVKGSGNKLNVQIKWPEPELAAVSYNSFYMGLFSSVYGKENVEALNPNGDGVEFARAHGIGDYMAGTDLYNETNAYFAGLTDNPLQPNDTLEIWSGYGIDGPGMGNSYQNYEFTYYSIIELEKVQPIKMSLSDITIYTGGNGYDGVVENVGGETIGESEQGFPTPGFYIDLPDELNDKLGESKNLAEMMTLRYDNGQGDQRSWDLAMYGTREHSSSGQRYVYKFNIGDGGSDSVRVQLKPLDDPDGEYILSDDFVPAMDTQYKEYAMEVYNGAIDANYVTADITIDGKTYTYPIEQGNSAKLTVRANNDEKHAEIVDARDKVTSGDFTAYAEGDTTYYVNDTDVQVADDSGVKLMVDTLLDEQILVDYLKNDPAVTLPEGELAFEQKYMDLVDTNNGDAYLTLADGDEITVFWPVPDDYIENGEATIYHFDGVDRDYNTGNVAENIDELIPIHPEMVTLNGTKYFEFTTSSFSPFVLAYANAESSEVPEEPTEPEESEETGSSTPAATSAPQAKPEVTETKASAEVVQTSIPQTGDESNVTLLFALMLVAGSGAMGLGLYAKQKKDAQ